MSSTRIALLALTLAAVALAVVAALSGAFIALVLTVVHPSLPEVSVVFDAQRVTGVVDKEAALSAAEGVVAVLNWMTKPGLVSTFAAGWFLRCATRKDEKKNG